MFSLENSNLGAYSVGDCGAFPLEFYLNKTITHALKVGVGYHGKTPILTKK